MGACVYESSIIALDHEAELQKMSQSCMTWELQRKQDPYIIKIG